MINKVFSEFSLDFLDHRKFKGYNEIMSNLEDLKRDNVEWLIGIDLAKKESSDHSCMIYFKYENGVKIFDRVEYFDNYKTKEICGTTKLECCKCSPCCEHRE